MGEEGGRDLPGKTTVTETGTFLGEFPYVRIGSGTEKLVILPGITLENEPASRLTAWTYRLGFGRFAEGHAVYVVNRRSGMPDGYTTREMSGDYAGVVEELGPSRVMGFSTGGSIAQYLALDRPDLVTRLVLVVSASRLSEAGRAICERWTRLARGRRWRDLRADMAAVTVTGETSKRLAGALARVVGGLVLGTPSDASDFVTTLEADLVHDTTGLLGGISAPALVVGGSEDPFFPEPLLRETAAEIPAAAVRVYGGAGHGVPKERKRRYEDDVLAFLNGRLTSPTPGRKEAP